MADRRARSATQAHDSTAILAHAWLTRGLRRRAAEGSAAPRRLCRCGNGRARRCWSRRATPSAHNFVGAKIDGYEKPICYLTRPAAAALAQVVADLEPRGLTLKVFDCYRPERAVAHFVRWARNLGDTKTKAEFYPQVDKRNLFSDGYIAARSGHSRGSTVDLTLARRSDGKELDMGTPFDFFSPRSWPSDQERERGGAGQPRAAGAGDAQARLHAYDKEWWHFTLRNEPYPQTYFDFVGALKASSRQRSKKSGGHCCPPKTAGD